MGYLFCKATVRTADPGPGNGLFLDLSFLGLGVLPTPVWPGDPGSSPVDLQQASSRLGPHGSGPHVALTVPHPTVHQNMDFLLNSCTHPSLLSKLPGS